MQRWGGRTGLCGLRADRPPAAAVRSSERGQPPDARRATQGRPPRRNRFDAAMSLAQSDPEYPNPN